MTSDRDSLSWRFGKDQAINWDEKAIITDIKVTAVSPEELYDARDLRVCPQPEDGSWALPYPAL